MKDRQNTINGWVLFAGIVALGASIVTGEVFKAERPETMGFPIEGVEAEGEGSAEAAKPIEFYLASADVAKGEQVFKKCAACHNADQGGANALGPNLWGVVGKPLQIDLSAKSWTDWQAKFDKALANPAREPEVGHNPTVKAALFLMHDTTLLGWLQPAGDNLTARLRGTH